jgi:hypothetical protein
LTDLSERHREARGGRTRAFALIAALLVLVGAAATVARAELTSKGNLFVTFDGGIKPTALPRHERAPITVWMNGKVRTLKGEDYPSLRSITIALNRKGHLETRGLPKCRLGELLAASRQQALDACRDALVGSGTYRARSDFPEQARTPTHGRILAFNGAERGHETILGHVYAEDPAPSANVIVFDIRRRGGEYSTVLSGTVPPGLTRWGFLKRISLKLHRNYTFRGERRSYLSAPCEAPRDLQEALFPFVFAEMDFDDGRELSAKLTRSCRVRAAGGG